jgi:hypothetical protein
VTESDRSDLSPAAEQRIGDVIRSLVDDHVDRGVDLGRPMRCDSCDLEKSPLGSSQYGAYALCNDCLLEFTLLLARGDIENVAEYMTKRPDDMSLPTPPPHRLESTSTHHPLPKRSEKLMPSNEPC